MQTEIADYTKIINTTHDDFPDILWLFEQAMKLQGQNGYKVWKNIDKAGLNKDIEHNLQYKILKGKDILCVFSVQYTTLLFGVTVTRMMQFIYIELLQIQALRDKNSLKKF